MNLRYIYTIIHNITSPFEYTKRQDNNWVFNTDFISDFLSKNVRKLKIDVPEFNFLAIYLCKSPKYVTRQMDCFKSLEVYIPFSQADMDNITRITNFKERIEAYLSIYERGYYIANEYCDIQVDKLIGLNQMFRDGGYRNEWLFKKKMIREYGIYVFFKCYLTSIDFRLELEVYNLKQTELLTKGVVLQTAPDRICFGKEFNKGIKIDGKIMYLLDFLEKPNYEFDLEQLSKGTFNVKYKQNLFDWRDTLDKINWMK